MDNIYDLYKDNSVYKYIVNSYKIYDHSYKTILSKNKEFKMYNVIKIGDKYTAHHVDIYFRQPCDIPQVA